MVRASLSVAAVVLFSSASAAAITREEVIARAQPWVDKQVPYCGGSKGGTDYICGGTCNRPSYAGHGDWDAYRSDCSGFVSYSWALPSPGRTTNGFMPYNGDVTITIQAADLEPGDALNNDHHVFLFVKWNDKSKWKAQVMEEYNCGKVAISHEITLTPSGTKAYSSWHAENYTAIRYKNIVTIPPNKAPIGALDQAGCDTITGWAQDPDAPGTAIPVHIYANGGAGDPNATSFALTADQHRDDLCKAIGSCKHGFITATPLSLLDGKPHAIHAYGIDTAKGPNPELPNAKTLTCTAKLPPGVRRHVTSGESMGLWKFSAFWQMVTLPDATLAADPIGPELPKQPSLVQADDGSPEVWLVDGAYRRHVPNPAIAEAWQFDLGKVKKLPAKDVTALMKGPPVRPEPFLVKGSGPEVWLVDDMQLPAPVEDPDAGKAGAAGGKSTGTGAGGDVGAGGAPGHGAGPGSPGGAQAQGGAAATKEPPTMAFDGDESESGGCSVVTSERDAGGLVGAGLVVAALALGRRRRLTPRS